MSYRRQLLNYFSYRETKVFTCSSVFPAFCSPEDFQEAFEELGLEFDPSSLKV